ncbi:transposase IS4 family protein, partial [mine drainage metagenome]
MTSRPLGLFDQEIRQRKLQALGDPLVELDRIVPWGMFRETLETMRAAGRDPRKGGRPPHDPVRMFKVLVLRELYALSDEQVEYQIADRLSFQRFLGIDLTQDAPDYTAIWRFRERLGAERMKALFEELCVHRWPASRHARARCWMPAWCRSPR